MDTLSYGAFSESLHRRVHAARGPLNGTIEVTRRCPLTCAHCYNNLPMGDRSAQLEELTTREHHRLLDETAGRQQGPGEPVSGRDGQPGAAGDVASGQQRLVVAA